MDSLRKSLRRLLQTILEYVWPAELQQDPQQRLRARRSVAFALAIAFWAPVFAPIYFALGSSRGAVMIACAAVGILLSAVSMRWTRSITLTGNLIAAALYAVLLGLAAVTGGIQAASLCWLPAVAITGLLLGGTRAGIAWAVVSCLTCLVLLGAAESGFQLPNDIPLQNQWLLDFAAICGIVLCALLLTYLFQSGEADIRRALEISREQSEQASQAKSTFLANMSHEIRTPLNAVLGMTELMRDTPLSRQQQEYLELAQDSGKALLSQVDDILDFSRIESGKLVLDQRRFELRKAVLRTLKSLALAAHSHGLELVCHFEPNVPRYVIGDPGRVRQIIMNLVGNAIKFTERGEVVVRVRVAELTADATRLRFEVQDTGIGIPADRRQAIFELFEQADMSTTRRFGGFGLGLAITSHLVQAMRGQFEVISEVGRGSTFAFTVRFGRASQDDSPRPAALSGQRVLVVEDHPTSAEVLVEMLSRWEMPTSVATHPAEALELITAAQSSSAPFSFMLVDCLLGDARGCELVEQVQKTSDWAGRVVMMLTSDRLPESVARCEQIGVHDYLVKPIGQWELEAALRRVTAAPSGSGAATSLRKEVSGSSRQLRVLVAEDSLVNQKLAAALVEKLGHEAVIANNGKEALAAWESQSFDLILMDVQMPEMDGLDATRAIRRREQPRGTHVPIVAVTAHVLPEDQEKCQRAGMDEYLGKPFSAQALAAVIDSVSHTATSCDSARRVFQSTTE